MPYREKHTWGEHLWSFIHTITIIDFEESKSHNERILACLREVGGVIPCSTCRKHYENEINKNFENLNEPMCLFRWSVDFHNTVNTKLGKPLFTYEQALEKWTRIV
jgi:hypothetical protein